MDTATLFHFVKNHFRVLLFVILLLASSLKCAICKHFGQSKWYFLGPWTVGKNELDGDPVAAYPGGVMQSFSEKSKRIKYYSELATGGRIKWSKIQSDVNSGIVFVTPDRIDWNRNVQTLSSVETQEWQGWAVAKFKLNKMGRYDIACQGVNTFFINTLHPLNGDIFQTGLIWNTVELLKGYNVIYVRLKMKGARGQFKCLRKKTPMEKHGKVPFVIYKPKHTPDLLNDFESSDTFTLMGSSIAIPTINHGNVGRNIIFKTQSTQIRIINNNTNDESRLGPSQTSILPLKVQLSSPVRKINCPVKFSVVGHDASNHEIKTKPVHVSLRCRWKNESFLFSYKDHDGSISIAAAIPPLKSARRYKNNDGVGECARGSTNGKISCPVVLSLHGTGVDVQMSADSFKYKDYGSIDSTPYTFGVENAWLIAATRGGAHNWEYTGYLAAMAALKALPSIIASDVPTLPGVDVNRVLYAGHSMGGHGSWILLTQDTDRAIGAVSVAGWVRKEAYGDSNRFLLHDIGHAYVDPAMKNIIEATFSEYSVDLFSSNFVGLPIMIRVGENDFSVPPWYSRKMSRLIKEHGSTAITYDEVKGKSHWWWDTIYPNDGGVMNDEKMRKFYKSIIKNGLQYPPRFPNTITHTVSNPASSMGRGGFQVRQQMISYRVSRISIEKKAMGGVDNNVVLLELKTENVKRIRIKLDSLERYFIHEVGNVNKKIILLIDGNENKLELNVNRASNLNKNSPSFLDVCYILQYNTYNLVEADNSNEYFERIFTWLNCSLENNGERTPSTYGPARQVFASPFDVVIGKGNDKGYVGDVRNHLNLIEAGGRYIANLHYASTDTRTILYRDSVYLNHYNKKTNRAMVRGKNVILIGGPKFNEATKLFFEQYNLSLSPPVFFEDSTFNVGKCKFDSHGYGLVALLPRRNSDNSVTELALLVAGTDSEGLRNALKLAEPTIPPMMRSPFSNQIPDFVITGPETDAKGFGGIVSLGFWDSEWQIDQASSYGTENCV
jgi:hypothetical protein